MSHEAVIAGNLVSLATSREGTGTVTTGADQFTELATQVHQHAKLLFKVAYGVLRNAHDAEDVVQETFLRAQRAGLQSVHDTQAWLATIAFRLAIDRKRKPEALDIGDFDIPAAGPDAEHSAIRRQQVERVQRLIASLPDDLRHPLVLSALEELNSRQIAEMLGINESSVRGRILRARQILREKLAARSETTL
ncbi:MAG TPA: RNA polymerase sigma factor [Candidatus Eisenbacteria bacterium]|nr:RNA polymerase sigma factor [Candidatus Eisenbacteria bacterium]